MCMCPSSEEPRALPDIPSGVGEEQEGEGEQLPAFLGASYGPRLAVAIRKRCGYRDRGASLAPPYRATRMCQGISVRQSTNDPLLSRRPALIHPTMKPVPPDFEIRMRLFTPLVDPAVWEKLSTSSWATG